MKYKLICVDIDGTLACDDKSIPEENKKALRKAYQNGINIAIASGRSVMSIQSIIQDLNIPCYAICLNGAYIEANQNIIGHHPFSSRQLQKAYEIVEEDEVHATFSTPSLSIRNHDVSKEWKKQIETGSLKADYIVAKSKQEYKQLIDQHQDKIVKISILEKESQKYKKIRTDFENLNLFSVVKSDVDYIDVTDVNCTKGQAVQELANHLNIALENVVCIGDNENDMEMIEIAGLGIVMENGVQSLKAKADFITKDNNHFGVAYAIENYILNK
ncbi:MAG: HAD family hydrolase [Coprobacillus sp.]